MVRVVSHARALRRRFEAFRAFIAIETGAVAVDRLFGGRGRAG